ncbi:efflux RND transporter periplasmic adaptor subunit [Hyphomicrobium sp.]|jgi:multidrug efflux system membrane fusion protein|uniref:efflux RND transporter periplasmic adaptor subunit n=1 Tax=Hyphomicrobium sp. TaxID=82 RepID=UPI003566E0E1
MARMHWGLFAAAAVAALAWWQGGPLLSSLKGGSASTKQGAAKSGPIPVTVTEVKRADFPVYLLGLGTVQPYRTVTIRSRVDGQITKVSFKQGQMVKQGDPLIEIDHRPYQAALDQVKAKKQLDLATLANAQKDLERYQKAGTLANSQQQIDTQETLVAQQQAQIAGDDAAIESAQTQLDYTTIASPLTGKIGFRTVDPGNIVHAADQTGIVSIVQLSPISVVLTAPEEKIPKINAALVAGVVPVDAFTSDGLKTLAQGHLAFIDNSVAAATGTIGMKATFQNDDQALYPGLSVAAQTLIETLKQAVVVPEGVVQHGPDGLFAFVVGADNTVSVKPIKVGHTGVGEAVVSDGLTEGQKVVLDGQYRLVAGSKIQATEATAGVN